MSHGIVRHNPGPSLCRIVEYNGVVHIAGTTADNKSAGCREQTAEVLKKIDSSLAAAGTDKSRILSSNVWVADIREKDQMDAAWRAWVDPDNKPVRACVEARLATPDTRVEIMVTAAK
ncbi:MAG: RidA family protein [Betaproteobacteria bacterium]|nr:RidA family protein [Betaproteobacteria bacterium]